MGRNVGGSGSRRYAESEPRERKRELSSVSSASRNIKTQRAMDAEEEDDIYASGETASGTITNSVQDANGQKPVDLEEGEQEDEDDEDSDSV